MVHYPFSLWTQKPLNLFILFSLSIPISNQSMNQSHHQDSRDSSINTFRIESSTLLPVSVLWPPHLNHYHPSPVLSSLWNPLPTQNHASSTAPIPILWEFPRDFRVKLKLPRKTRPRGSEWCDYCLILTLVLLIFSYFSFYLKRIRVSVTMMNAL